MALDRDKFRQAMTENALRSCQLFTGLPAAALESVAAFAVTKHPAKGQYPFRQGDPGTGVYGAKPARPHGDRVSCPNPAAPIRNPRGPAPG
mgnify:CR=1 FL=1